MRDEILGTYGLNGMIGKHARSVIARTSDTDQMDRAMRSICRQMSQAHRDLASLNLDFASRARAWIDR